MAKQETKSKSKRLSDEDFIIALRKFINENDRRPSHESENHLERNLAAEFDRKLKDNGYREVAKTIKK